MSAPSKDRLIALLAPTQTKLNGIDFVEVANSAQTILKVHFLKALPKASPLVKEAKIHGGDRVPTVEVHPITPADWFEDGLSPVVLTLHVDAPGDFSTYTLTLVTQAVSGDAIDPYFDHVAFSFKATCESTLDCKPPPHVCPEGEAGAPPIDYLAKDFQSFKKALLDFSALRYPSWQERSEADFGVMFLELLAATGDDLSYLQDRIAAESALDTATERRSVVRHARMVDYEPRPRTAARALLSVVVPAAAQIPEGLLALAQDPAGPTVEFETGTGLYDTTLYDVDPRWNAGTLSPYWWDDDDRCLARGATDMWVKGHKLGLSPGKQLLLDTAPQTKGDPSQRELVTITSLEEETDPLFAEDVTHVFWASEAGLAREHDLTRTSLSANLVPATQGHRFTETFAIETAPSITVPKAVSRTGANGTPQYLHTLRHAPLAWLVPPSEPGARPVPEIRLVLSGDTKWDWRRTTLDADPFDKTFTLDPMRYSAVGPRRADGSVASEYDGSDGDTVRFGDGTFGRIPATGSIFEVSYRVGGGAAGNVAADAITRAEPGGPLASLVTSITNPFPATGGADPEPDETVRRLAPEAFRAEMFRAVLREDYESQAEKLAWVQRARATRRWTGSWMTVFTAADPRGAGGLTTDQHIELVRLIDRVRLAGVEAYAVLPRYVPLDIEVTVCARPEAFRGDVRKAVLEALGARALPDGTAGFFHVDRFTFGTPLERSAVEAAVQRARGVHGVIDLTYRRRGAGADYVSMPESIPIGPNEVLRVDNNPSRPELGSVAVYVEGGQ